MVGGDTLPTLLKKEDTMKIVQTRNIDSKGRVAIPPEVRKMLKLNAGDTVCFEISRAGALVIRKVEKKEDGK